MDCLMTKLRGTVNDNSLLKLGEVYISITEDVITSTAPIMNLMFVKDTTVKIVEGDNDFYADDNYISKIGKTVTFTANEEKSVYLKKGIPCKILVPNKYDLVIARLVGYSWLLNVNDLCTYANSAITCISVNSTQAFGDLEPFIRHANRLEMIGLNCQLSGDMNNIPVPERLKSFYITDAHPELAQLQVTVKNTVRLCNTDSILTLVLTVTAGNDLDNDISAIAPFNKLTSLRLYKSDKAECSGDLSAFASMTGLTSLIIQSSKITGYVQSLANTKLTGSLADVCKGNKVAGDLSFLPSGVYFISFQNNAGNPLTWTSGKRASTYAKALAIEQGKFADGELDKFLIDNAACDLTGISSRPDSWSKIISVSLGNRTSNSDSAVTKLQEAGFTLSIPSASSVMLRSSSKWGIAYKDNELIVEPVNLSVQTIYPSPDVTVKEFATEAEAREFISLQGLVKEESK